jgi:hypothetical protein
MENSEEKPSKPSDIPAGDTGEVTNDDAKPANPVMDEQPASVLGPRPAKRVQTGRPPKKRTHNRNPPRRVERPVITPRISCFTRDDGTIDFDRTTDDTIQKLARAIQTPEAQRRLGLVDGAGQQLPPRTWAGMTTTLVDAVNAIAVQAAVNTWKLTDEQAAVLILRRDPATHQTVAQLTGEILDKYFPGGFGAWDKEISLLVVLGGFVTNGYQQIQAMKAADSLRNVPASMAA